MLDEKLGGIARVIRVTGEEKPPSGFSWGDFEDVEQSRALEDEDDGWNSVPVKSRKRAFSSETDLCHPLPHFRSFMHLYSHSKG